MRHFTTSALGLVAALAAVGTASDVHDLKTGTFDSFVTDNNLVLAEFFAPWWVSYPVLYVSMYRIRD